MEKNLGEPTVTSNVAPSSLSGGASVAEPELPACCAGEGYPGIAHDFERARAQLDESRRMHAQICDIAVALRSRCESLEAALRRLLDDPDCNAGAELGPGIARLYVKTDAVDAARALLSNLKEQP